jgi:hypothetical protein
MSWKFNHWSRASFCYVRHSHGCATLVRPLPSPGSSGPVFTIRLRFYVSTLSLFDLLESSTSQLSEQVYRRERVAGVHESQSEYTSPPGGVTHSQQRWRKWGWCTVHVPQQRATLRDRQSCLLSAPAVQQQQFRMVHRQRRAVSSDSTTVTAHCLTTAVRTSLSSGTALQWQGPQFDWRLRTGRTRAPR